MEFFPLLLILLTFFLLFRISSRARKTQKEALELQERLAVGDRVVTTSGLHATVAGLGDGTVVLETGPGQQSTWVRQAIGKVLPAETPETDTPEPETAPAPRDGEEFSPGS